MACHQNSGLRALRDAPWRNRRTVKRADAPPLDKWGEDSGVRCGGRLQTLKINLAQRKSQMQLWRTAKAMSLRLLNRGAYKLTVIF